MAIVKVAEKLGYSPLKEKQVECLTKVLEGHDVFCVLPTGYGKTVCFACLPGAHDLVASTRDNGSIVIVVSPLTALIKDHVRTLEERNLSVGYVDGDSDEIMKTNVTKGNYSIVFMSPEMLVDKWRKLFTTKVYQERLVGLVIDEAHCVVKW